MNKLLSNTLLIIMISFLTCVDGRTCTTFCISDSSHMVLGKNFDFYTGVGHVVINNRNIRKLSFAIPPEKAFEWTSKYGSITFNQIGKEFPYGGMNEKGLVIEQMWLQETGYPELDDRNGLIELQWIQYQLDNSETVDEVLASDSIIRISKISSAPLHFLVGDAKGNIATIEYLDGKMVYHTKSSLPICALANDSYNKSKDYVNSLTSLDVKATKAFTSDSMDRFAKANLMIQNFGGQDVIDYSFEILAEVSQESFTRWSIVYDIKNMTVHYRSEKNHNIRKLTVADIDFTCNSRSLHVDIEEDTGNDELNFLTYTYKKNRETMDKVIDAVEFMQSIPKEEWELIASYPETTNCVD